MDSNLSIKKINQSRYNLKKYLDSEWDVSTIQDYSDNEIENLYKITKSNNPNINFGAASSCNFSLYHRKVSSHVLHVIYYNFPEIGKPSVKITKTCSDKINNLYKEKLIGFEDSVIIILYNPIPENLDKAIEELYLNGQQEILINDLSENIKSENKLLNEEKYSNYHFRNIHIYHLDSLCIDITQHIKVPKHVVIRDQPTIDNILIECNSRIDQLPVILRNDPMAKILRLAPGDICKITRTTRNAGEIFYYRVCK